MKFDLDKKDILNISSNLDVYQNGETLYKNKLIDEFEMEVINGVQVVKALIDKEHEASLKFEKSGKFISHTCTCNSSSIWRGGCSHIIAILFYLLENIKELMIEEENKKISKNLLDLYTNKFYENIDINKNISKGEKVKLEPEIFMKRNEVTVGFNVYIKRKYVVKDIGEFLDNINNKRFVNYGKELEFVHDINAFDNQSQKLIGFLKKEYSIYKNYFKIHSFDEDDTLKNLNISKIGLDTIFSICINERINIKIDDNYVRSILVSKNLIDFEFNINVLENMIHVKIDNLPERILYGEKFDYFLYTHDLIVVKKELSNFMKPFAKSLQDSTAGKIIFKDEYVYLFKYIILPELINFKLINEELQETLSNKFNDYMPRFYLDVKKEVVVCTLGIFHDEEISLYDEITEDETSNYIKFFVGEVLKNYGFVEKNNSVFNLKDKDLIYNFYKNGLKDIKRIGELFSTEDFENRSYVPDKSKVNFNVKIDTNLLEVSVDSNDYTLTELIETLRSYENQGYYKLKSGKYLNLEDADIKEARDFLRKIDFETSNIHENKIVLQKYKAFQFENFKSANITAEDSYLNLIKDVKEFKDIDVNVPKNLDGTLRDYQIKGFKWLKTLSTYGFGGILADDMGLGKTVQIISLLESDKEEGNNIPSMVVCPMSLVFNWANEIEKFGKNLKVEIVIGLADKRVNLIKNDEIDVFITTYDTLKRDIENYKDMKFKYVIADEAQYIKNYKTQNAKAIKKLQSENNFALTGTPIENSLVELWSIFDFVMPGYLFNLSKFTKLYSNPIMKDNDKNAIDNLKKQIAPFVLKRNKKDVLKELPDKIETVHFAKMTTEQEKLYNAFLLEARGEINAFDKKDNNQMKVLTLITRLRQISCHPSIFIDGYKGGSGKLSDTMEIVTQSIESGHRILLFSQFTSMLDVIKESLDKEKIEYFYLDGSVNAKKRMEMVDEFNSGSKEIFLISLKAGGSGLNLTGADVVIHYDPWWNYSVMAQATDRAHRIGQDKVVQVINVVSKNSIEEKILKLQEKKENLIDSVLDENLNKTNKISYDEILELLETD